MSPLAQTYLRSARWRNLRRLALKRAEDRCQWVDCNEMFNLDIHHLHYETVGSESLDDVVALCRPHHIAADFARRNGLDPALRRRKEIRMQHVDDVLDRDLLRAVVANPKSLDTARSQIEANDFRRPSYRGLWVSLCGEIPDFVSTRTVRMLHERLRHETSIMFQGCTVPFDWACEVEGAVHRIVLRRLRWRQNEMMSRLKVATAEEEQVRLMKEIDVIARQLHEHGNAMA